MESLKMFYSAAAVDKIIAEMLNEARESFLNPELSAYETTKALGAEKVIRVMRDRIEKTRIFAGYPDLLVSWTNEEIERGV